MLPNSAHNCSVSREAAFRQNYSFMCSSSYCAPLTFETFTNDTRINISRLFQHFAECDEIDVEILLLHGNLRRIAERLKGIFIWKNVNEASNFTDEVGQLGIPDTGNIGNTTSAYYPE